MSTYIEVIWLIYFTFAGACMGSFLCCASNRYIRHVDFIKGHSVCDSCGHKLGALDLIPVFSWLSLHGKCRYCGAKIPARSTFEEIALAGVFAYAYLYLARYEYLPLAWVRFVFLIVLGCVAVIDAEIEEVPYTAQGIFGLCALAASICPVKGRSHIPVEWGSEYHFMEYVPQLIGTVLLMVASVILAMMVSKWIGQGDVVIFFACIMVFSFWSTMVIVLISSLISVIIFVVEKHGKTRVLTNVDSYTTKLGIRLVPVITVGAVIVSYFQDELDYIFLI